ncbi:MAG: helix-turn-helix transcriptional regulator [Deltaproteobacteria bacterium]|nr:helix-turn-helix transcriptional regulator [Deltaproteobacteria bacterium]
MARELTDAGFRKVAGRFRLLADPARLKVLYLLRQRDQLTVGETAEALGCSQPQASRQLAQLHRAGILRRQQLGNTVRYSVADPSVFELCETVCGGLEGGETPQYFKPEHD